MAVTSNATAIIFNDSTVQTTAGSSGVQTMSAFTSSGTWTKPATVKSIKVTVVGGGGNGGASQLQGEASLNPSWGGGGGGAAIKYYPAASLPGPQPYSVGGAGGTSSFGAAPVGPISATGGGTGSGAGLPTGSPGLAGTGGAGSGGNINVPGQPAALNGFPLNTGSNGGGSIFSGDSVNQTPGAATNGTGIGQGGSGRWPNSYTAAPGGTGAPGAVVIEEFN